MSNHYQWDKWLKKKYKKTRRIESLDVAKRQLRSMYRGVIASAERTDAVIEKSNKIIMALDEAMKNNRELQKQVMQNAMRPTQSSYDALKEEVQYWKGHYNELRKRVDL